MLNTNFDSPCNTCTVTLGNLGNECADHAAALGTFGLTSSHNVATRSIHHNFDTSVCFDGCDNISETLERLQHIRTNAATLHRTGFSIGSSDWLHRVLVHFT